MYDDGRMREYCHAERNGVKSKYATYLHESRTLRLNLRVSDLLRMTEFRFIS